MKLHHKLTALLMAWGGMGAALAATYLPPIVDLDSGGQTVLGTNTAVPETLSITNSSFATDTTGWALVEAQRMAAAPQYVLFNAAGPGSLKWNTNFTDLAPVAGQKSGAIITFTYNWIRGTGTPHSRPLEIWLGGTKYATITTSAENGGNATLTSNVAGVTIVSDNPGDNTIVPFGNGLITRQFAAITVTIPPSSGPVANGALEFKAPNGGANGDQFAVDAVTLQATRSNLVKNGTFASPLTGPWTTADGTVASGEFTFNAGAGALTQNGLFTPLGTPREGGRVTVKFDVNWTDTQPSNAREFAVNFDGVKRAWFNTSVPGQTFTQNAEVTVTPANVGAGSWHSVEVTLPDRYNMALAGDLSFTVNGGATDAIKLRNIAVVADYTKDTTNSYNFALANQSENTSIGIAAAGATIREGAFDLITKATVTIDSGVLLKAVPSDVPSGAVQLSAGDVLQASSGTVAGLSLSPLSGKTILITGNGTRGQYIQAIQAITYKSGALSSAGTAKVAVQVENNGLTTPGFSNIAYAEIGITNLVNDPPVGTNNSVTVWDATNSTTFDVATLFTDDGQGGALGYTVAAISPTPLGGNNALSYSKTGNVLTFTAAKSASQGNGLNKIPGVSSDYTILVTAKEADTNQTATATLTIKATNQLPTAKPIALGSVASSAGPTQFTVNNAQWNGANIPTDTGDSDTPIKTVAQTNVLGTITSVSPAPAPPSATGGLWTLSEVTTSPAPAGTAVFVTFNPAGYFNYLAQGESAIATLQYQVVDSDGGLSPLQTITVTVNGVNDPPFQLQPLPVTLDVFEEVDYNTTPALQLSDYFSDEPDDQPNLRYYVSGLPAGMTYDPLTGDIEGVPNNVDGQTSAPHEVTIWAYDNTGSPTVPSGLNGSNSTQAIIEFWYLKDHAPVVTLNAVSPSFTPSIGAAPHDAVTNEEQSITLTIRAEDNSKMGTAIWTNPPSPALPVFNGFSVAPIRISAQPSKGTASVASTTPPTAPPSGESTEVTTPSGYQSGQQDTYRHQITVTYTPTNNLFGLDEFEVESVDYDGQVQKKTIKVWINPGPDAPNVVVGGITNPANQKDGATGVSFNLAPYFTDVDGPPQDTSLTFDVVPDGANPDQLPPGLTLAANGLITSGVNGIAANASVADTDKNGVYKIRIRATDSTGLTGFGTFSWTITNEPLSTNEVANTVDEDVATPFEVGTVAATDGGADNDPWVVSKLGASVAPALTDIAGSRGGLFSIDAITKKVTFKLNNAFQNLAHGQQVVTEISYEVKENYPSPAVVSTATNWIRVTVTGKNDTPTATPTGPLTTSRADGAAAGSHGYTFSDVDSTTVTGATGAANDALTYSATGLPLGLGINPTTGALTGTVASSASQDRYPANEPTKGKYTITITAQDNGSPKESVSRVLVMTVTNPLPASPGTVAATKTENELPYNNGHVITGNSNYASGKDSDGDTMSAIAQTNQSVSNTSTGSGTHQTYHATFNLQTSGLFTVAEDTTGVKPSIHELAQGQSVVLSRTFEVQDADGAAPATQNGVVNLTVNGVNDQPVAYDKSATVDKNQENGVDIILTGTDIDIGGTGGLTVQIVSAPGKGVLTVPAYVTPEPGPPAYVENKSNPKRWKVTYTPEVDSLGADSFTYTVTDALGSVSAPKTVSIAIDHENNPPVVVAPGIPDRNNPTDKDKAVIAPWNISVHFNDPDLVDGDTLKYTAAGLPPGLTLGLNTGIISGKFAENASNHVGPYEVIVTVTDSDNNSVADTFLFTVHMLDTDGDNVPDYADMDKDGDGIPDARENELAIGTNLNANPPVYGDTDGDGIPDYLDLDSDNDGIWDAVEAGFPAELINYATGKIVDPNGPGTDGVPNSLQWADGTGIINFNLNDTDGDTRPDYVDLDSDNDSIPDLVESGFGTLDAAAPYGVADDVVPATGVSATVGHIAPRNTDSDVEGIADYRAVDSNGDGVLDIVANGYGHLDGNADGKINNASDFDWDGLPNNIDGFSGFGGAPLSGFTQWKAVTQSSTDTDGDLFSLSQEYALGGSAHNGAHLVAGSTRVQGLVVTVGAGDVVTASFARPQGRHDVGYKLLTSTDLTVWTPAVAAPSIGVAASGVETIGWNLGAIGRGYARLEIAVAGQAVSYTIPQGWSVTPITSQRTSYAATLAGPALYTGVVADALGPQLFTSEDPAAPDFTSLLGEANAAFYVEVLNGAAEGHRFDISVANSGTGFLAVNTLSANNTTGDLPDLEGARIAVRKHATISSLLPQANWAAGTELQFRAGNGWVTYVRHATPNWVTQVNPQVANNQVVLPGSSFFIVKGANSPANKVMLTGEVRFNAFRNKVAFGADGYNAIASGFPLTATPNSMALVQPTFQAATSDKVELLVWDAAANGWGSLSSTYGLFGQTAYWTNSVPAITGDQPLFGLSQGAVLKVKASTSWVQPVGWTDTKRALPYQP